jgi:NAD-dependent deacetylase
MLAELEKQYDVTIITQNVDDLHERAGSSRVIHLHGELKKVTSSLNRFNPGCIKEYPLDVPIKLGDKAADGSQLRPFIVWFGEYLGPEAEQAVILVENADIFVVIGTSLVVYPAAGLVNYAHHEVPKFLIDPGDMQGRLPEGFHHIQKTAVEGIDILMEEISKL